VIVGGGNSAGQAALYLARMARSVRVIVRRDGLAQTMSRYLVDRIDRRPNIEVVPSTEVVGVNGNGRVESVRLRERREGDERNLDTSAVFLMIGADPCTESVTGMLGVNDRGFLLCGDDAGRHEGDCRWPLGDRTPHLLETVRPGVFAAGDVRVGATNRVAGAVGDGALAVRFAHSVLDDSPVEPV
jgi:thioredoxin reductase (NADPH)